MEKEVHKNGQNLGLCPSLITRLIPYRAAMAQGSRIS